MRVLTCGGGSGGHVKPVISVVHAILEEDNNTLVAYIGDRSDLFAEAIVSDDSFFKVDRIFSGKIRRYPGQSIVTRLTDFETNLLNFRDLFYNLIGLFQSLWLIRQFAPDVIFSKGGYPSVPVVLAGAILRIPIVTHDSDAIAGISNRLTARWATVNAVASAEHEYPYDKDKTVVVGVPVDHSLSEVAAVSMAESKKFVSARADRPLVLVIGGSLGAESINQAMQQIAPELIKFTDVAHISGATNFERSEAELPIGESYELIDFISDPLRYAHYNNAADLIVSRAGATSLAEIATVGKPAIVIPARLSDQLENATSLSSAKAAVVISDRDLKSNPEALLTEIKGLVNSKSASQRLAKTMAKYAKTDATKALATIIYKTATGAQYEES